ncbi:N-methyl-L-tryptophan oxidase [Streptomyces sulphureus]|uniref:N-methyl-L-tryptophan oxidase n=1 Tax=Streptomyces sulphureus TaxID=47758 RepID=UPI00036AAE01|nr:N-methyl-L-tryptophan oxidase [Streptomyces sulphureus]
MDADVIVLGLGAMGSAAAHRLAARGATVLGLERHGPAHDRGSSHGSSRIIRQAYFEDPAYVPLLLRSYELFGELEEESGRALLTRCGGLMIGPAGSRTVAGSLDSARRWELPHELLDASQLRRRHPTFAPGEDEVAVWEPRAGAVRPEATVAAQLALAARSGAELRFHEPAFTWEELPGGRGVRVETARGVHTAAQLAVCPGAWAPRLLDGLGVPFAVERHVQQWFQPDGGTGPFGPERHPVYIWEDGRAVQVYGFPALDGPEGGVKAAFFRNGTDCDPEHLDRSVHPSETRALARHLAPRLPSLPGAFLRGDPCMYTTTPDEHFVLGRHPAHPGTTVVVCGFSGHGFKFAPVVGEITAELLLDGATRHPVALFDPTRFSVADAPPSATPATPQHSVHRTRGASR